MYCSAINGECLADYYPAEELPQPCCECYDNPNLEEEDYHAD